MTEVDPQNLYGAGRLARNRQVTTRRCGEWLARLPVFMMCDTNITVAKIAATGAIAVG